jgi:hypothetical protein
LTFVGGLGCWVRKQFARNVFQRFHVVVCIAIFAIVMPSPQAACPPRLGHQK